MVRDVAGAPISDSTVTLEEKTGSERVEARTIGDGKFSFSVLRPGTYVVRVTRVGFRGAFTRPIAISPGQTKIINFALKIAEPDSSPGVEGAGVAEQAMVDNSEKQAQHAAPLQKNGVAEKRDSSEMEFSDAPNFAIAGVADWNNVGLHASETNARTSEALAKDAAGLKDSRPGGNGLAQHAAPLQGKEPGRHDEEAAAHREAGDRYEKTGDALSAEREYEAAAHLDPDEGNTFAWGTELLVHRAIAPAVEVFSTGVQAHGDSARMRVGLGAALYASGSVEEAARRVCEASDLQPADTVPYLFLGKMQLSAADSLPCVEEKLARFVRQQPENALANYYYAVALWKKTRGAENSADFQKQEALLQKAARCDPKLAEAYVQLGILYAGQGGYEQAMRAYKQALAANPDLGEAHYRLSLAYKRLGNDTKAAQEFALYKKAQEAESAAAERQRKELQQFVVKEREKDKKEKE